jgi:hypothetical protein
MGGRDDRRAKGNGYVSPELQATSGHGWGGGGKAPVYQNTANSIAGLGTNTTNGIANQNTQAANAEMAGSAISGASG